MANYYSGSPLPHTSTGDWRDKDNLLHKVWSPKKKNELFKVLQNPNASHFERLWLVGFLKWVKYDYKDILNIIHNLNEWSDYNPSITKYHVASLFNRSSSTPTRSTPTKPRTPSNNPPYTHVESSNNKYILYYRSLNLNLVPLPAGRKHPPLVKAWNSGESFAIGTGRNVGVIISNGLIGIDIDNQDIFSKIFSCSLNTLSKHTWVSITPHKGFHIYFYANPPLTFRSYILRYGGRTAIEIYSHDRYFAEAPSHLGSLCYRWLTDIFHVPIYTLTHEDLALLRCKIETLPPSKKASRHLEGTGGASSRFLTKGGDA